MTRINVVPVNELCDQHLFAEFRELTRIPNKLKTGKLSYDKSKIPAAYTVQTAANPLGGKGHEYFFTDKLLWLEARYEQLYHELRKRHYNVTLLPVFLVPWPVDFFKAWQPTEEALFLNRTRLIEKFPAKARYCGYPAAICTTLQSEFFGVAVPHHVMHRSQDSWILSED